MTGPVTSATLDPRGRRVFWWVAGAAALIGVAAAAYFAAAGLTLSHYDARGHLIVARRVFDSLTPGWRQIGAVWLPLPHVLNVVPVQWDWAYRTGVSAVAISIAAMSVGLGALGVWLWRRTGSAAAALLLSLVILLNPNVLYLQSTPMTEPLLLGLACVALLATDDLIVSATSRRAWRATGILALLVLTRYEGWFIAAGLWAVSATVLVRQHLRSAAILAAGPVAAACGFFVLSWATTGRWFTDTSFFVADNPARHDVLAAAQQVVEGLIKLAGRPLLIAAAVGTAAAVLRWPRSALSLGLLATAALPIGAFTAGHPFRIRYMVPLVAVAGVLAGATVSLIPARLRGPTAAALLAACLWAVPPLSSTAPMLLEAQWDVPNRAKRAAVTAYLGEHHDGTPILASMGSLGHYMHEAAEGGLDLRDFLHEGNGDLWQAAVRSPARIVQWVLIEERAEGGDMLFQRAQADPGFLSGFTRVADGGGLALFRRAGPPAPTPVR